MVAKTNLDQFAAGLVGTRTPYGTARNPFDDRFITGGSSSGSGAAVGGGLLSFALGTDTAGSGMRASSTFAANWRTRHKHRCMICSWACKKTTSDCLSAHIIVLRHASKAYLCT